MSNWSSKDRVYGAATLGGWVVNEQKQASPMGFDFSSLTSSLSSTLQQKGTELVSREADKLMNKVFPPPPPPPAGFSYQQPNQQTLYAPAPPAQVYTQTSSEPLFDARTMKMIKIGALSVGGLVAVLIVLKIVQAFTPKAKTA